MTCLPWVSRYAQHELRRAVHTIEEMDRQNLIVPNTQNIMPDNPKELALQLKQTNLIHSLHILKAVIKPIITAGNNTLEIVDSIEDKVKELSNDV